MLDCREVCNALGEAGVSFAAGVPDSLLKDFCASLADHFPRERHVISSNEGGAVAAAAGYFLATGEVPLVYLQNSGHGNALNPLLSLADPAVYGIPLLMFIGWRGEPGVPDEPQHAKQGGLTPSLCETTGMPYRVLPKTPPEALRSINELAETARRDSTPVALIVRKNTFAAYASETTVFNPYALSREEVVKRAVDALDPAAIIVSTTGKVSRELFEYRESLGQAPGRDFLTVGSMGHASQVAMGIALAKPDRKVLCLDGDGAVLMHMGSLAIIGSRKLANFKHLVVNNGAHDSVGGQPTAGFAIDMPAIARACGYRFAESVERAEELEGKMSALETAGGPALLEVRTRRGAREDLGRPTISPAENKRLFMKFLGT